MPEITLRAAGVKPPMMALLPVTTMPMLTALLLLPATVPVMSVPMKQPSIRCGPEPSMRALPLRKPLIAKPRRVMA
ncbi:MAG: hypothetical protein R3F10_01165 [Lysobacteraceae bacterium]